MAMKMKVGRFNISISAEDTILTERTRDEATCYLLNHLTMILTEAADLERKNPDRKPEDAVVLANMYEGFAHEVYTALKKHGFYDDLYKEEGNDRA